MGSGRKSSSQQDPVRMIVRIGSHVAQTVLAPGEYSIGTAGDNEVCLDEPTLSRHHALIRVGDDGTLTLEDLGSSNGSYVNAARIDSSDPVAVGAGDRLRFGAVEAEMSQIDAAELEPEVAGDKAPAANAVGPDRATLVEAVVSRFCVRELPGLMQAVRTGAPPADFAARIVNALGRCTPRAAFVVHTEAEGTLAACGSLPAQTRSRADGEWRIEYAHPDDSTTESLAGPVELALHLLALGQGRPSPRETMAELETDNLEMPKPETRHAGLADLYRQARRIGSSDISVLIEGATGTGKELFARFVHRASGRGADKFVELNCAALPEDLLEAELFGIESGVATGVSARAGKFELADQGTLLLDEIGDMALVTQAKILRVLQEQQVYRLGSNTARPARVRILAATNQPIGQMVEEGRFRRDLFHRIADWTVTLPTLRQRRDDVINLAAHFLEQELSRRGLSFGGISKKAAETLRDYSWPGNVRELEREMKRCALFLESGEMLRSEHLQSRVRRPAPGTAENLKARLAEAERSAIRDALASCGGDVARAAGLLELGKSTLYRRIKELEL